MKPAVYGLFGLCAALAALLVYEIAAPMPSLDVPAMPPKPRTRAALGIAAVTTPPPGLFVEIDTRPPFNPTRKGVAASTSGDASSAPPDLALVGIIVDNHGDRLALVKTSSSPLATALRVGSAVSGWRVTEIAADRIVLGAGPARSEIRLEANRAPPPQPKPAPPTNSQ